MRDLLYTLRGEGPRKVRVVVGIVLALLSLGPIEGTAQPTGAAEFCQSDLGAAIDPQGLQSVYCLDGSVTVPLRWAHASARPVFYGAVPAAWVGAWIQGGAGTAAAYRLTLTQGTTYGGVLALKHLVGRPRPYLTHPLSSRASRYGASEEDGYTSFPSGHAALSAALATSWALSYPRWYVVGPGAVWALGVGLSRLYLGVHYPSDVIVGALLGLAVAGVIHQARGALTPPRLQHQSRSARSAPLPAGITIQF